MSLVTRGRGSGTDEEAGRRGSGTDEEAGQRRGSGTGPILLSQATFLLAHIANSGPVPLSLSPKPKTFKSRSRITHPSVAESEPTALMTERSKCLWWLYSRMASVQSHQRIKLCRGRAMVLSPRKAQEMLGIPGSHQQPCHRLLHAFTQYVTTTRCAPFAMLRLRVRSLPLNSQVF